MLLYIGTIDILLTTGHSVKQTFSGTLAACVTGRSTRRLLRRRVCLHLTQFLLQPYNHHVTTIQRRAGGMQG